LDHAPAAEKLLLTRLRQNHSTAEHATENIEENSTQPYIR